MLEPTAASIILVILCFVLFVTNMLLFILERAWLKSHCAICAMDIDKQNLLGYDVSCSSLIQKYKLQPQKVEKADVLICKFCLDCIKRG
jgi:hypothetical protein